MRTFIYSITALFIVAAVSIVAYATDLNRVPYPVNSSILGQPPVPDFGNNGNLTKKLTVNEATQNLQGYVWYDIVIPASLTTCQLRLSASSPSSGYGTNQATVFPAGMIVKRSVNAATPFANLSGCTNAYLEIQ